MAATFVPNPGFAAYVLGGPLMARFIAGISDEVARLAESSAPYRLGLLSGSVDREVSADGGTIVGKVTVSDFKWRWHEFGTWKMAATPFLRPALVAVVPNATTGG